MSLPNHERLDDARIWSISRWLNGSPRNRERDPEALLWSRVTKVCEESGEVWRALSDYIGENPRRPDLAGHVDALAAMRKELLDTAVAALAGLVHTYGDDPQFSPLDALSDFLGDRCVRVGLDSPWTDWQHARASGRDEERAAREETQQRAASDDDWGLPG